MNTALKRFILFLLFFLVAFFLYLPTIHSRFVFDFVDLFFDFKKDGFAGLITPQGVSSSLVSRFILYSLIYVIGLNEWLWYVLAIILHALNALLLYLFASKLLFKAGHSHKAPVSFLSALIFLVLPYHTEVIVWGGAFNYLLVSFFVLLHLNAVEAFFKTTSNSSAIVAIVSFILAVFSHEWGLFLLPANLLLFVFYYSLNPVIKSRRLLLLGVSFLAIISLYFYNQFRHGQIIGHYGADTHLRFSLKILIPAIYKYLLKLLLITGFLPVELQTSLFNTFERPLVTLLLLGGLIIVLFIALLKYLKNKQQATSYLLFISLFVVFLFPVLNLYFPYWIKIQGDRYCYLPAAFLIPAVLSFIFQYGKLLPVLLVCVFLFCCVFLLQQKNRAWQNAGDLIASLELSFPKEMDKNYYLLNVPDNYTGAYMFRNTGNSCFAQTLRMKTGVDRNYQITDIQSYNLQGLNDSVIVSVIDSVTLRVELSKWGSWWWRTRKNFEDERIKVNESSDNHSYIIQFKKRQAKDVIMYQSGSIWREVTNF